jgi:hypothetical protein
MGNRPFLAVFLLTFQPCLSIAIGVAVVSGELGARSRTAATALDDWSGPN